MHTPPAPSRDERRRRSEAAILEAARQAFAECGFERTTIRGVARAAGVDPALVMQHFGSKEGLFAAAARWREEHEQVLAADRGALPEAALADFFGRTEDAPDAESAIALMRACLTHPTATAVMRDDVMCRRTAAAAGAIGGADAELRAALLGACMIGLAMARHIIRIEPLAGADRGDVERLLLPALRALVDDAEPRA